MVAAEVRGNIAARQGGGNPLLDWRQWAETRERIAAQQPAGSLPWIGVDDPSEPQRLQADYAARVHETANFQLGGREKLTRADDPQHALQKNGGLADLWYMDDGDIMCHPILVPSYLQEFDDANAKVGAERSPQKTEVIHHVNDLDAAPLEWRIHEVQNMTKSPRSHSGKLHTCSGCRTATAHHGPARGQGRHSSARTRRQSSPSFEKVWELAVSTTSYQYTATQSFRNSGQKSYEVGQRSLERLFPGLTEDSVT